MRMVRFDQAIRIAQDFALEHLSQHGELYLIRDLVGRVSIALNLSADALPNRHDLSLTLHQQLEAFSPVPDQAVQTREDLLLPEEIFASDEKICLDQDPQLIYLLDRLMTNRDWLRTPLVQRAPVPTAVAFSLKGGVGRSTAFAAWAYHLARLGRRVLAVDLDLEAPGLQTLLLRQEAEESPRDRRPDYGVVDWLVEQHVTQADSALLEEMLGSVELAPGTPGEIQVIPAFGRKTRQYVTKLGRAYLSVMTDDGAEQGFAEGILALLHAVAARPETFDVALLDVRAGLHDIGAAAVTRLGAHAFLFARNDPQTWTAYAHLFEHLKHSPALEFGMPDHDLRWRMNTVGTMIGPTERDFDTMRGHAYALWQGLYDEEQEPSPATPEETDQTMPHWPLRVMRDEQMRGASFQYPDQAPTAQVLASVYGDFFERANARLFNDGERDA
jgi:hypothetical protein